MEKLLVDQSGREPVNPVIDGQDIARAVVGYRTAPRLRMVAALPVAPVLLRAGRLVAPLVGGGGPVSAPLLAHPPFSIARVGRSHVFVSRMVWAEPCH